MQNRTKYVLVNLVEYFQFTRKMLKSFIHHAMDYRFLDLHARTWICKSTTEAAIAVIIG